MYGSGGAQPVPRGLGVGVERRADGHDAGNEFGASAGDVDGHQRTGRVADQHDRERNAHIAEGRSHCVGVGFSCHLGNLRRRCRP